MEERINIKEVKFNKEGLTESISKLSEFQLVLQENAESGDKVAQELNNHVTTAINAMAALCVFIDKMK